MTIRKILISSCLIAMLVACGKSSERADSTIDGMESGAAEEATIEAAIMQGRTAARSFLNADPSDTLALQTLLLDARASQSKYVLAGKRQHAEAFDTAFIHTLRAANPEVARSVEAISITK